MVDSAVRLQRVTRVFDGVPAISHVMLDIPVGEVVWVCGANGSGKSTLLRVIATALSPTFGSGTVLGGDLRNDREWIRAHLELLGHQSRLYGDLTALENLAFICRLYDVPRHRAPAALERVGLDTVADVRTASFSQGMRQRLALARCLMRRPELVLLDEPYAGLDVDARAMVDQVLSGLADRGATVLVASHEPPPSHTIDRRVVLEAGRVRDSDVVTR